MMKTYDFSNLIAETYVIDVDKGCISYTSNQTIQQGEHQARLIQAQLVKEDIPVDLTNCNVYFYTFMPQHQDKPTVTKCEIFDATQGMVTVKVEEYMSRNAGTLECEFERIGMDRTRLPFKKFQLSVDGSISANDAIENSEPLSALVDALAQVTEWDYRFEEKYNGLEREYAQELNQTKQELVKTNAQLSKKANSLDVRYKSDKILLSDLSTEVKETMTGGSVGVVGESSVNFENLTEDCVRGFNIRGSRVGRNKLDVMSVTPNYTVNWQNGEPLAYDGCAISDFIPCLPSTAYYYSYRQNVAFYDNNKVYISGIPLPTGVGMEFITPDNARYIRVGLASTTDSQGNKLWNTFYLCELNELQEFEPYVESSPYEYDLFQKENSSITIEKDNRGRIVNIAETIGNKTTNTYISYGENGAISNITENNGEYESTITVSKNLIERKVKTLKGVY